MKTIYIYIFEDGTFGQSESGPTKTDLACSSDGIISIIRLGGNRIKEYDKGEWVDLPPAKIDVWGGDRYHVI